MQDKEIEDDLFYKIEKKPENEEIVYYYSRENRLARGSQRLREHNENQRDTRFISKNKLVRAVAGHRGNLFILLSLMVIFLMYFIIDRITAPSVSDITVGNNSLNITIDEQDSLLFLSVRKTAITDSFPYTGAVDIVISPVQSGGEAPIFSQRIFFTHSTTENYLISLPFDGSRFIVLFQTEFDTVGTTINK